MMTRKPIFTHGNKHHPSGHGNRGSGIGAKVPAVLWSHMGPSTLLLAPTNHHPLQLPLGARKIVNPVTVNALKSFGARCSGGNSYQGCTLGTNCCSCCYCCCEADKSPITNQFRLNNHKHTNNPRNSRLSTCSEKPRRRRSRSRSRDKLSHHSNGVTPFRRYSLDVRNLIGNDGSQANKPRFVPVTTLEDVQAIRCAEFHPRGFLYAVGSNSKSLRICAYPDTKRLSKDANPFQPNVLFKRNKHHRGSIYCLGWSPDGNLLATGSNDKTVKLIRFDDLSRTEQFNHSQEVELSMHDGTVRDICFIEDLSNKSSLLVSGGAGDCKVYVTDCVTGTPFQSLSGHSDSILTLANWGGAMFASGSQDKTIRLWDLRSRGCVSMISPLTSATSATAKSPVGSVCVDPTGRLLISGHEDSAITFYDIRGSRQIQVIRPHTGDVRSVRFSPHAYYLLSGGYDHRLMLTDLQGDLSLNLTSVPVASHDDKVICGRWHPTDFSFLSTSADKTATLWALPVAD